MTESISSGLSFTCVRKSEKLGGSSASGGLISRWAKNASTITIRIGNAALLKNLLIGMQRGFVPPLELGSAYQGC